MKFVLRASALACSLLVASSAAWSLGRGADPTVSPVVDPRTNQTTDIWRLAGFIVGGNVSAVQIAPSWILAAKHAAPAVGAYFGNGFGAKPVAECFYPGAGNYEGNTPPDLALCRLAAPLATPVNLTFPHLVESPSVLSGTRPAETVTRHLGSFLSVGYGAPHLGEPRYVWTDLIGMPIDPNATAGRDGLTPLTAYRDAGDSGSPAFWFSPNNQRVALVSVAQIGGSAGLFGWNNVGQLTRVAATFSMPYLQWLQQQVQSRSQEIVQISTAQDFHGTVTPSPSLIKRGSLKVTGGTTTSVSLSWQPPEVNPGDVNNYMVSIERGSTVVGGKFVASNQTSTTLTGLVMGQLHTACVLPVGAGGPAPFGAAKLAEPALSNTVRDHTVSCVRFQLDPMPGPISNLSMQIVSRNFGAIGTWPSEKITWTRPSRPSPSTLIGYDVKVTADGQPSMSYRIAPSTQVQLEASGPARTVRGQRLCATITPVNQLGLAGPTAGPVCAVVQ